MIDFSFTSSKIRAIVAGSCGGEGEAAALLRLRFVRATVCHISLSSEENRADSS